MRSSETVYIMLIGMPGSGKSYLRKELCQKASACGMLLTTLSTDDWIDRIGETNNRTYSENFKDFIGEAESQLQERRKFAFDHNWSVIHDQTNLTVGSRRKKLAQVPKAYHKIAIYMTTPDDICAQRRAGRVGKEINQNIILTMQDTYQPPMLDEGFDMIVPDYMAEHIFNPSFDWHLAASWDGH